MHVRLLLFPVLLSLLGVSCQRQAAPPVAVVQKTAVASKAAKSPARAVFPYSVISGGIGNATEMAKAVSTDPVVRDHYWGLDPAKFKPEVLQQDHQGYVSYRVRDKIFWTRRMMTLKKGELVLTDGKSMLRGRCGNRISAIPQMPVAAIENEPTEEVLNSWQLHERLAGIPPVPEKSPMPTELTLTRIPPAPEVSSLLFSTDAPFLGYFSPGPNLFANFGSGGGVVLTRGDGGALLATLGTMRPPDQPRLPVAGNIPGTELPPTLNPFLPLTPTVPFTPNAALPLDPLIPVDPPGYNPPVTYSSLPPTFTPPVYTPPYAPPTGGNPPVYTPPTVPPPSTPPGTPPTEPPSVGVPPPTAPPPPVSDAPPSFPPPAGPPPEEAVPEPATLLLMASALVALGAGRYFSTRK